MAEVHDPVVDDQKFDNVAHLEKAEKTHDDGHGHLVSTHGVMDDAAKVLLDAGAVTWTVEEEKRVIRKVDIFVCIPMCLVYFIQQMDKSSVSYAAVFNLQTETHLVGSQYSWLSSIVYISELVFQPLSSYALVAFPVKYWVIFNFTAWGIVTLCTAAAKDFTGLIICRFFLGVFESTILPAFIMITQMWWTRREQSYRTVAYQVANSCAAIIGPLMSYAVGHGTNSDIKPYQSIFIFMGAFTIACVPILWYLLPNSPVTARFLKNGNDRVIAIERLRANNTGTKTSKWKWSQARECFQDPKSWIWAGMWFFTATPSGGIGAFGGLITKGFGFSTFDTILMQMPTGAIGIILITGGMFITNRIKMRFPVVAVYALFPIAGAVGLLKVNRSKPGDLMACYYVAYFFAALQPLLISWANLNCSGHTKKVCTAAMMFVFLCAGNVIGPQVYLAKQAPKYFTGLYVDIACWAVLFCLVMTQGFYLMYLNKKQEKRRIAAGRPGKVADSSIMSLEEATAYKAELAEALRREGNVAGVNEDAFEDMTDWENMDFMYVI